MQGISWIAENLLASEEGLCSMELVSEWMGEWMSKQASKQAIKQACYTIPDLVVLPTLHTPCTICSDDISHV